MPELEIEQRVQPFRQNDDDGFEDDGVRIVPRMDGGIPRHQIHLLRNSPKATRANFLSAWPRHGLVDDRPQSRREKQRMYQVAVALSQHLLQDERWDFAGFVSEEINPRVRFPQMEGAVRTKVLIVALRGWEDMLSRAQTRLPGLFLVSNN